MPHCIIEHSSTIDDTVLLEHVYQGVVSSSLFEPDGSDIKLRTLSYTNFRIGTEKSEFIHVTLKILSGRTGIQKSKLSALVLDSLKSLTLSGISITVEVVDIDRDSYAKHVG
ncbi:5-carboxymethyl-2-hydroxymuconate isomerase [Photobacterium sanctipauli]|uniref:5-carboxymethyl-2-hydroxymuconate isomerase n=1 Tax=Photobacterium sanctipauli TaxID=1342794 RepID=A0A2T3NZU4_9GAMM|nr:5-carboxymethyl-2-hydroxymuconate isomerase [Photobacterium sanctipauli]PSW21806.1 5-carboxymethyl-2-hydroxymuconate isomerase [Photobacterium sanctipauli]